MSGDEPLAVNREMLAKVLSAIKDDADTAQQFRWKGNPETGVMLRGDDEMVELRCEEIKTCIIDLNPWQATEDFVHRVALLAGYQAIVEDKTVDEIAGMMEEKLTISLTSHWVAFEVHGLKPGKTPIRIGEYRIGLLQTLTEELDLEIDRELWGHKDPDPAETVVVMVQVDAPDANKTTGPAGRACEEALDLLATIDYRARFNHGPPWEPRIGRRCWIWPDGESKTAAGVSNEWMHGYDYEVNHDVLTSTKDTRFQAPIDAWLHLPEGDMRDALTRAYVSIGAAMRRAPDAHASVTRAWTAIETVYAMGRPQDLGGDRSARAVANRFKLAAAAGTGTTDPFELARFYFLRNDVLHEAIPWQWSSKAPGKKLWPLYLHLDHLAGFCITEGITTREELDQRLNDAKIVEDTRKWIESWMDTTKFRLEHAVLKEVKRRHGEVHEFYQKVLKACGKPRKTPLGRA